MENTELIDYCNSFNQRAEQYQESVQDIEFGTEESNAEQFCDDLGIVFLSGE